MRGVKLGHVALALVAVALAAPAAGTTKATRTRAAERDRLGGLPRAAVGEAVRAEDRLQGDEKYGGSSDEMVTLMRSGGGGQYDMVSASGDASFRLIYGGDVATVDVE